MSVAEILRYLGNHGPSAPRQIAQAVGVSAPNIARVLGVAGDEVWRSGKGRSTRYARTRRLQGLGPRFPIHRVNASGGIEGWAELVTLAGGHSGLSLRDGADLIFDGLPPFAADMAPQGYLGRHLAARISEPLALPPRLVDWNDDHRLLALVRRGEDTIGDLIIGEESLARFYATTAETLTPDQYIERARSVLGGDVGSSAGGEHPKFSAFVDGRHVLVKFASAEKDAGVQRWRDLLIAEAVALEQIRAAGLPAPPAKARTIDRWQFLEVERFDRIGERGRRAVLSFFAVDSEYLGVGGTWSEVAAALVKRKLLPLEDLRRVRWLEVFGNLIGNTDRHLGNLSLFGEFSGPYQLAPVYDMLPMAFAPTPTAGVVDRALAARAPQTDTLEVWPEAATHATTFWARIEQSPEVSTSFRALARRSREAVEALRGRVNL